MQKALRVFNIALTWRSTVFTLCVSECAILIYLGVAELKKTQTETCATGRHFQDLPKFDGN